MSRIFSVLNMEPLGYSKEAITIINSIGSYSELDESTTLDEVNSHDVIIVRLDRYINNEIILDGTNIKYVVTATTGLDHIDLCYLDSLGIKVLSLRGESEFLDGITSTSEFAVALLLMLMRNIVRSSKAVEMGIWDRDEYRGNWLKGKEVGIVGYGRIGKHLNKFLSAFGCNIKVFDPYANTASVPSCSTLVEILSSSDIVLIACIYNDETHMLLNNSVLQHIKNGAFIVNISRGNLWDEGYVAHLLESGKISGVAADVLSWENSNDKGCLTETDLVALSRSGKYNCIVTPHIGGATFESMKETEIFMAKKLKDELSSV